MSAIARASAPGVAVDAQDEFAKNYRKYRPHTKFFVFFVSDHSDAVEVLRSKQTPRRVIEQKLLLIDTTPQARNGRLRRLR